MKNIKVYESGKNGKVWHEGEFSYLGADGQKPREMQLIQLYPDIKYQEWKGFGGAFTPASANVYSEMDEAAKAKTMELLFDGERGLAYTCGRISIAACDFAAEGNYSYCDKEDKNLTDFSVEYDKKEVFPFLHDAQKMCGNMEWLASPWSPPAWMKTNGEMCHGGKLKPEYRQTMADYMVRFLQEYEKEGIHVGYLTVQNEPHAVQVWESCIYTAEEEKVFVRDFLTPALKKAGLGDVKIIVWDHNKENVFNRLSEICSDKEAAEAVSGVAFHWYSGDHFENLSLCAELFPGKELIFTEGCVEITESAKTVMAKKANAEVDIKDAGESPWTFGECYGHDILGNLNHGMNRSIDWNILLNEQGGPNHVGNYCSAPLIYDRVKKEVLIQPSYIFISHFSRFIKNGARRIGFSRYTDKLQVTSWVNKDGVVAAIVMNETEETIPFAMKDMKSTEMIECVSEPHSIMTVVYEK